MTALGLFPVIVVLAWAALRWRRGEGARAALLTAAIDGGVWVVIGVELLSSARAIFLPGLLLWWSIPAVFLVAAHRSCRSKRTAWPQLFPAGVGDRFLLAGVLALLGWALVQAVVAPPNTVDVLTYHLPRQVYWQQQGGVQHYATNVLRQLTMPPFAEFTGLNLLLLSGGDYLHNLVQWTAMVGTLLVVTAITRELGGGTRAQLLAAFFMATVPSAFLQASSSKNDLVVALWLAVAIWGCLRIGESRSGLDDWRLGAALGLLALTKGTGLIFGPALALLFVRRTGFGRSALRRWVVVGLVFCLLNLGHWSRNLDAFGSPYGPEAETHGGLKIINDAFTPRALASNVVRNLAAQLALPFPEWNQLLLQTVLRSHDWLGLSPDDPATTYRLPPYVAPAFRPTEEDLAAAPIQVAFVLLLPALLLAVRRRVPLVPAAELWMAGALGFLLFCGALKWQAWHPRIVFPLGVFFAPVAGLALGAMGKTASIAGLAMLGVLAPSLNPLARPLLGPRSLLHTTRREAYLMDPNVAAFRPFFEDAVAIARVVQPRRVGFLRGWNGFEYVFQVYLPQSLGRPLRFSSWNSVFIPRGVPEPDPDLGIGIDRRQPLVVHEGTGTPYALVGASGGLSFYVPAPRPGPAASPTPSH